LLAVVAGQLILVKKEIVDLVSIEQLFTLDCSAISLEHIHCLFKRCAREIWTALDLEPIQDIVKVRSNALL